MEKRRKPTARAFNARRICFSAGVYAKCPLHVTGSVIEGVWYGMERLGMRAGAHILEPSMGIGHFFGLMPASLYPGTKRTGVELDSISARIASTLYPDSNIRAKAFEDSSLPNDFFDAAVGNIPFGNYPVSDPAYKRTPCLSRTIHDYFLAKSVDLVRPGGIVALITSRFSLDKQDATVRKHLADRAVLLGAVRLPSSTFRENAGTDVTTDIVFLQKRSGHGMRRRSRGPVSPLLKPQGAIEMNEYFARHREMMLGQMGVERGQYASPTPYLEGKFDPEGLRKIIDRLPANVFGERQTRGPVQTLPGPSRPLDVEKSRTVDW